MAIKLAAKKTILWPTTINVPTDGGRTIAETFDVEYRVLTQAELVELDGKDMLELTVVGWPKGPKGEDGEPVPFSEEAKRELLQVTYARAGMFNAYSEIQVGRAAARKN